MIFKYENKQKLLEKSLHLVISNLLDNKRKELKTFTVKIFDPNIIYVSFKTKLYKIN